MNMHLATAYVFIPSSRAMSAGAVQEHGCTAHDAAALPSRGAHARQYQPAGAAVPETGGAYVSRGRLRMLWNGA